MEPKKILFTDDDELIGLAMADLLGAEGFQVTTAACAEAGIAAARAEPFDLVIVDLIMPGMLGFEVCRALRAMPDYVDVPIVMLTAKSGEEDRKKGLEAGATRFLAKPIDPTRLLAEIREALGS